MDLTTLLHRATRLAPSLSSGGGSQVVQPIDGLQILRQTSASPLDASVYEPVLCLILQGRKQVTVGERTVSFGPGECLLVSHDLPVCSSVTVAPYLALVLALDVAAIRELYAKVADSVPGTGGGHAAQTYQADPDLLDALGRYLALADSPVDAPILGPLVSKEIHYRLLVAPFGSMLRRLLRHDSNASAIARAIGHIRADIRAPIAVAELARRVGMSVSSFHQHFKAITSTTPLQFQKDLRLLEARLLLTMGGTSVTAAASDVGYESPSQFSREYARKFGVPPSREPAGSAAPASHG